MKNAKLFIIAVMVILAAQAYAQELPKKEFALSIAEKQIVLSPGETKAIDIKILRSKSYRNSKIDLVVDSRLPDGVDISFADGADPKVDRIMTIITEPTAEPFQKLIVVKGKSTRTSKGVMIDLSLDAQTLSSN